MKHLIALTIFCCAAASAQTIGTAPTVYRVSQLIPAAHAGLGCNPKTELYASGATCADESSALVAVALLGTANNPVEIRFDISVCVGSTFSLPKSPYLRISGINSETTGLCVLPASNATAICNGYNAISTGCQGGGPAAGAAPATAGSVVIEHLFVNGNRGTYPNGNSNATDGRCANWCQCITLANLAYLKLDDLQMYDCPTYGLLTDNVDLTEINNVRVVTPSLLNINTDGLHFDGPVGKVLIHGLYCATGDDCIALNIAEGYGGNGVGAAISNMQLAGAISGMRVYTCVASPCPGYTIGSVTLDNVRGFVSNPSSNGAGAAPYFLDLGYQQAGVADAIQSVDVTNANVTVTHASGQHDGPWIQIDDNVGRLSCTNCTWTAPAAATPFITFGHAATVSDFTCANCTIYRNAAGHAAAFWGLIPGGSTIARHECNGCAVVNEQGRSDAAIPYGWDVQSGGTIGTFVMTAMDPGLMLTLLNGNEWSRLTSFYGSGVSAFFRNTTYANLPPATYAGLKASISDSNASGVWGTTESGGSPGHFAEETSNGTNWTVSGK